MPRGVRWRRLSVKPHSFRHCDTVLISKVSVRFRDQDTAVFMSKPAGNRFEVNTRFDGIAAEKVAEGVMSKLW